MARIAYLLLSHRDPARIAGQAAALTAGGDAVAIHFDANAPQAQFAALQAALRDDPAVAFTARRLRCGWGGWSLVAATLEAVRTALRAFPDADHLYLISGDCLPVKSAEHIRASLAATPADRIESVDFFTSGWIRTGLRSERLIYRHPFNERSQPRLFYASLAVQRRLRLSRPLPADLDVMIGSQWWCLRRSTLEAILAFLQRRPDVLRFFRTTWIPDETFFQTLVRHLVPTEEILPAPPTFLVFTDYGMPAAFHDDHHDFLLDQPEFFARKISPEAEDLRRRLVGLYAGTGRAFAPAGGGRRLHGYLTGRGRVGRRFAPRFWEDGAAGMAGRELLVIACKKWDVGQRLAARIAALTGLPALGYPFDEADASALPDLGGIEATLARRHRHRRAFLRMLYEVHGSDRLVLCLDPHRAGLIEDAAGDGLRCRVLPVACATDDAWLAGHAARIGLVGAGTPPERMAGLLPALRADIAAEHAALSGTRATVSPPLPEDAVAAEPMPADAAAVLAGFLGLAPEAAAQLAAGPDPRAA